MAARAPVSAVVFAIMSLVVCAAALTLAGWAGLQAYDASIADDAVSWTAQRLPAAAGEALLLHGRNVAERKALGGAGAAAFVLLLFGLFLASRSSVGLLPAGVSDDGFGTLELKTVAPRVGRPVEGMIRLQQEAKVGEVFTVALACSRTYDPGGEGSRDVTDTAYRETQDVRVVSGAGASRLPFRFEIPPSAPPTSVGNVRRKDNFQWRLHVCPAGEDPDDGTQFQVVLQPATAEALRDAAAAEPAELRAEVDSLAERIGSSRGRGPLLPHERAGLVAMTPERREEMRKILGVVEKPV